MLDTKSITLFTTPPIPAQTSWPFKGYSIDQLQGHLRENFEQRHINPIVMAVLDVQTMQDKTCLLVSEWESEPRAGERLTVRSDFRSALVTMNSKNMAVAGDELFETTEADGVIRLRD